MRRSIKEPVIYVVQRVSTQPVCVQLVLTARSTGQEPACFVILSVEEHLGASVPPSRTS